ncbi:MAG: TraV family lipoprotein [Rhodospirillaceae bacterium]|nr:TraV family lipoprotein [Rhodospirillaceae bacterium]
MTMKMKCARPPALAAIALAALVLAGCSSGHVGEDWQCPLAAGGSCASVAAADPAVPKAGAMQGSASGQPLRLLPRDAGTERADPPETESRSCETACGFGPFAWLARLFGAETEEGGERPAAPEPAALAAETTHGEAASGGDGPVDADLRGDDLRTGEAVARIWIAPFVDAGGIYREGAWVRVVLEPAGWRLP